MTDSCCYTTETNTTLQSNFCPIKKKDLTTFNLNGLKFSRNFVWPMVIYLKHPKHKKRKFLKK